MDKKLKDYLDGIDVKYKVHGHPSVFTVEESKKIKQDIPGMHCKTLFVKDNKEGYYLIGMPADKRLDSKNFRKQIGVKKIRFGTAEELKKKVNLTPGSVSIFGAIYIKDKKVKLILDKEIWDVEGVGFHPNVNTSTIVLSHVDLKKFYESLRCEKKVMEL